MALLALEASKWDGKALPVMVRWSHHVERNNNRFDPFGVKGQEYPNGEPIMVLQSIRCGASLPAPWSLAAFTFLQEADEPQEVGTIP